MRPAVKKLLTLAALAAGVWMLLDLYDRIAMVYGSGGFDLKVELVSRSQKGIRSVSAAPFWKESDAESMRLMPEINLDDMPDGKRFQGQPIRIHICTDLRLSGLGWRDAHHQADKFLALWVELDDGSKHFVTAPIPDGRRKKSMVVLVP